MKTTNVLRQRLREDKPTIGTHTFVMWPGMVEVIGHTWVIDYVEFSGQYAPYNLFSLEDFARAVDLFDNMTSMMKIDEAPKTYLAERAVGAGIQNSLFADIRDPEQAREAVAAMRPDTPEAGGRIGAASRRSVGYVYPGIDLSDYVRALEESVVALMIEKREAIEKIEDILAVEGVDMVQFGSSDYSMTIGKPGKNTDPEVVEAEDHMIETALRMGVAPRAVLSDWRAAERYIKLGVKHFCVGMDIGTIYKFCQEQGGALARALGR